MWEDPIVADVHRSREKLAEAHNFDIRAFFAEVRRRQATLGNRLVRKNMQATADSEHGQTSVIVRAPSPDVAPATRP
jgi:hypothetical protein